MRITPAQLHDCAIGMLAAFDAISRQRNSFDPALPKQTFHIATSDLSQIVLLPGGLLTRLRSMASGVAIRIVPISVFEGRAKVSDQMVQDEIDTALQNQAIKHFIDPNNIAELVKFLCGKHARTISGQSFLIDGDSKATQ